jgi:Icc-related predicted phosphoesterase
MKLHVVTDVHLEFQKWRRVWDLSSIDCDVHVLAGDIGNGFLGLDFALQNFTRPIIYVAGNHEHFSQKPMQEFWRKAREKVAGSHVHLLENESVVFGGTRFLGCTLWSDYRLFGDERQEELGKLAEQESNDFGNIFLSRRGPIHYDSDPNVFGFTRRRSGDRLTWKHVAKMHERSREYLEAELDKTGDWNSTVVVTHHAPSISGIEQPDLPVDLDAAYASNLDHLVAKADLWIHGHVHSAREYQGKFGGRVVENARGYKDAGLGSVPGFTWDLVVDTNEPVPERKSSCKP